MPRIFRFSPLPILSFLLLLTGAATPALASQDVVQFGSPIEVGPNESVKDAVCFFCGVDVKGTVHGDIVAFFGDVHIDGQAKHDVVVFFGGVTAEDDSTIGEDLVNFFGGVRLGEDVSVGKDVVAMFGSLHAASSAKIGGDRVHEPGWIFWGPLLAIVLGLYFLVHEVRNVRRRRILGGY